jgi:hypothetical protein
MKRNEQYTKPVEFILKEEELTPPELDFSIRKLDEYTYAELDVLFQAVTSTRYNPYATESSTALDVWCYRIRDARKAAMQREGKHQPTK